LANRYLKTLAVICIFLIVFVSTSTVTAKTIDIDGDFSDWNGITPIITDPEDYTWNGLDVKEVYMTHDDDYLYVRIDFYGAFSADMGTYNVYLDTDRDSGTGSYISDIGVEVQFGVYSGSGYGYYTLTGASFSVDFASSGPVLEIRVALSDLGSPSSFDSVVMCYPSDAGVPLNTYVIGSNPQAVSVDGYVTGDWTGSSFFTDTSGDAVSDSFDLTDCWIGDDGTNLYFRMDTLGAIDLDANGDVWLYYDTSSVRVPFANYAKGDVIEGWISLTDLSSPSEVWPMFYMMSWVSDVAPDSGHATYNLAVSVGGLGFVIDSSGLLSRYLGISAAFILCIAFAVVFSKKLKH